MPSSNQQSGVSLIEVLIALLLGIVIIFGATRALSTMIGSSRVQMGNNDMQQTAELALSYIAARLRNASATPCNALSALNRSGRLHVNTLEKISKRGKVTDYTTTVNQLMSRHGITVNTVKKKVGGQSVLTDNLTIANATETRSIRGDTGVDNPSISLSSAFADSKKNRYELYAISNCDSMDLFMGKIQGRDKKTLTPYNDSNGNGTKTRFRENYREREGSVVSRMSVAEIEVDADGGLRDDSIFKKSGGPLMTDVELLRVLFAVDSHGNDGVADRYISAKQLARLGVDDHVISAELFLLVRDGAPDKATVPRRYTIRIPKTHVDDLTADIYADANVDKLEFSDHVMRRLFIRTVTFRNNASL